MGQVTAYTAAKTEELLGDTVQGAHLYFDYLILEKKNGQEINVGSVRGPAGPTGGISETDMNAAILASENNAGKGLVALDEASAAQTYSGQANVWVDVTGVNLTYNFVSGRSYELGFCATFSSAYAGGTTEFSLGLRDSGNTVVARAPGHANNIFWTASASGKRIAPSAWSGNKTLKLSLYASVNEDITIMNDINPSQISVVDLGVL